MPDTSKKIKTILLILIFLTLGTVISIFIGFRMLSKNPDILIDTIKNNATLSIENLHQTATRDGKQEWTLDAKSARLIQAQSGSRSILENLSIVFYLENQNNAHLTANHGVLENNTSNFTVTGKVVLMNPDYNLHTEELRYNHKDRILYSTLPADISGEFLHFSAEKISFQLNTRQARLEGKVEGTIRGKIQL